MNKRYKVMLVDDERAGLDLMESLLLPYKGEFEISSRCSSVSEVKRKILRCKPDLIFLDIQMPENDGFDLIKDLKSFGVDIPFVFITAYEKYMLQAFKAQPLDYLMKPVDKGELAEMLLRFKKTQQSNQKKKFKLPQGILTNKGVEFVEPESIVYIETMNRKSLIHLFDGKCMQTAKTLKELIHILPSSLFCRVNKGTVVNLKHVVKLSSQHLDINIQKDCVQLSIGRSFMENLRTKLCI